MGFRFRKSIKILPGVRVNLSKKGVSSVSIGPRGAKLNVGENGSRVTVGIPGTGISYSENLSSTNKMNAHESISVPPSIEQSSVGSPSKAPESLKNCLIIALALVILVLLLR